MNFLNFLLNKNSDQKDNEVVEAPAFSITKVMAIVAPVITALVAVVTSALKDTSFSTGEITVMIVSLVAFLAITASADVLARGIATSASKVAESKKVEVDGRLRMIRFPKPLKAKLRVAPDGHQDIEVLAASDAQPTELLCVLENQTIAWRKASDITF